MYKIPVIRLMVVRDSNYRAKTQKIEQPADVALLLQQYLAGADRENLVIVMMDTKNKVIGIHTAGIGTLNAAMYHPREIFKAAIMMNSAGIIIGHNHPSTDCTPSKEDILMTERMIEAGKILGIPVLDSIIASDDTYYSIREEGHLDFGF